MILQIDPLLAGFCITITVICAIIIVFGTWYLKNVVEPVNKEQEEKPRLRISKSEYPEHQLSFNAWQWWLANRK